MFYRELEMNEVEKIKMIDATYYIKNAWRMVDGKIQLVEIDWTDYELPNGLSWHMNRFKETLQMGGKAFGCFDGDVLIGYVTMNSERFGSHMQYVLLDQLFVSKDYRNKGIGKELFYLCIDCAKSWGVEKIYLCAGSSENTIAFYRKIGCVNASEINQALYKEDPNDFQLEYRL